MPSCGSICVVYGFQVEAERFDEALRERRPVDVGIGDDVRVVVADRAVDLAGELDARRSARAGARSRATTFAISLPSVVGDAVWPCVRDSIGCAASACAMPRSFAISASSVGSSTSCARVAQHQRVGEVVDVLAGAGEVDEFERRGRARRRPPMRSLMKYSTALTSWLVVRSIALMRAASATEKSSASARSVARRGCARTARLRRCRLVGQRQQPVAPRPARGASSGRIR